MSNLSEVIQALERQRTAIVNALEALRATVGLGSNPVERAAQAKKGGITPEGRRALSASLKKRWALKRAAQSGSRKTAVATKKRRGRPPGRKA